MKLNVKVLTIVAAGWLVGCAATTPMNGPDGPVLAFIEHKQGRVLLEVRGDALYPVTVANYEILESLPPKVRVVDVASDEGHDASLTKLLLPSRVAADKYRAQTRSDGVWKEQSDFSWHGDSLLVKTDPSGQWVEADLSQTRLQLVGGEGK